MNRHGLFKRRSRLQRRGWLALLLGAACLLVGLASGIREFFLVAVILSVLLPAAWAQAALQRPYFSLELGSAQAIRGQARQIFLLAHNPHPWPLFPARLRLSLLREGQSPLELANYEILLKGREQKKLKIEAVCPHRGEYQVLLHQYYAEDVFGFFTLPGQLLPPQSLLSLPNMDLTDGGAEEPAGREDEESRQGRLGLQGQLIAESRPYHRGDAWRAINWKKSLSRRTLFSRLRESAVDYSCCLLVDNRPAGTGGEASLRAADYEDRLCEAALSFLFTQLTRQQAITLLPAGLTLQSPQGLQKAAALLANLPFAADDTKTVLNSLLESHYLPDTLFLALAQPPSHLSKLLEQFAERGCSVVCVVPTADSAAVADGLELPLPLISIDPPRTLSHWLEV